jgi:hypothetical protein
MTPMSAFPELAEAITVPVGKLSSATIAKRV